jgi:hypothetical protein
MLLDQKNPYREGPPQQLRLTWEDFDFQMSAVNDQAIGQVAEWTVMSHMAADCDLAALMFDDLTEMKTVGSNALMHVCALFDGPLLTDSFFARLNHGTRLSEDIVLRFNELKSNDTATLTMALQVAGIFPAKRRLLFLSGHGSGWKGALLDQNLGMQYHRQPGRLILPGPGTECDARLLQCQKRTQDHINCKIEESVIPPHNGLDVLAFDACYMGNIEAVANFVNSAKILVVSEDQMPGEGYPYDAVLAHLRDNVTQSPIDLVHHLVNDMRFSYESLGARRRRITQVALASDRLPAFAGAFVHLVQALAPAMDSDTVFGAVRYALEKAWAFERTGNIDLKGFVLKLLDHSIPSELRLAAKEVLNCWSDMVLASAVPGQPDTPNGLSIYAPAPLEFDIAYLQCSNELPLNLGIWSFFLAHYYMKVLGAEAPRHPLIQAMQQTMEELVRRGIYNPGQMN